MKHRFVSGTISLFMAAVAYGGVTVTVEDGAKTRVDGPKLAKITESAIKRAAPKAAVNVSIVVSPPEVWRSPHPLRPGMPYPAEAVPPSEPPSAPDHQLLVFETVRARYTITDANGAMIESVPLVFDVGHGETLQSRLLVMHTTADYIAARVADLTK